MPIRNAAATIRVALARAASGAGLLFFAYVAAGLAGGTIPVNRNWRPPEHGVRIYLESNGIHVGIVVPKTAAGVDWRPLLTAQHLRDPRYAGFDHVSFGWGDAKFYVETPTWWDLRPGTVVAAAVGSDRTLVHIDHVPAPQARANVRTLVLTPDQYRRLARHLRASMTERPHAQPGYWRNDAFYTGTGRYSAIRTCNDWAGNALRYAGVRVGAWTPFPVTVLWWFPPASPASRPSPPRVSPTARNGPHP